MNEKEWFDACWDNNISKIKEMIDNGIDINIQDEDGWTALHFTCKKNNIEIVKILLKNGIDINIKSKSGWTALHVAKKRNYKEIVGLLEFHREKEIVKKLLDNILDNKV